MPFLNKPVLLIISLLIILGWANGVQAQESTFNDGVRLYIEASEALTNKYYADAVDKFARAAPLLSGAAQDNALRMADFVSRMNPIIRKSKLIQDSRVRLIGEVLDGAKTWHLYTSKAGFNILHLAFLGNDKVDALADSIGQDLVSKAHVIKNRYGYISRQIEYLPGSESRLRFWYCADTNITHLIYESFPDDEQAQVLDDVFLSGVECGKNGSVFYLVWFAGVLASVLVLGLVALYIFQRRSQAD